MVEQQLLIKDLFQSEDEQPKKRDGETARERLRRFLSGDDIFISYSRADATNYALKLASRLTKEGLSCFIDQWGTPPGEQLPEQLIERLQNSTMLVLIGTARAIDSQAVRKEVEEFLTTGGTIIAISVEGTLEKAYWYPLIRGSAITLESKNALKNGVPSDEVIDRIVNAKGFTRRNKRLRRYFFATVLATLAVLAAGSVVSAAVVLGAYVNAWEVENAAELRTLKANIDVNDAGYERTEAETAKTKAEAAQRDAEGKAVEAENRAVEENKKAEAAIARQADAEGKRAEAERLQQLAETNAQRQRQAALSRRLSAQADLAHSPYADLLETNLLYNIESLKLDYSLEAYRNLLEGIRRFPVAVGSPLTHQSAVNEVVFSPDGKFIATRAGKVLSLWQSELYRSNHYPWQAGGSQPGKTEILHDQNITITTFSRRGKYMATANGKVIRIWEMDKVRELPPFVLEGDVHAIDFSDDEQYLAAASKVPPTPEGGDPGDKDIVRVWLLASGHKEVASMEHADYVVSIDFNPDEKKKQLATASGGAVRVWGMLGGAQKRPEITLRTLPQSLPIMYSHDGRFLASRSTDNEPFSRVWDMSQCRPAQGARLPDCKQVADLFSPRALDMQFSSSRASFALSTADDQSWGTIRIWNVVDGQFRDITSIGYSRFNIFSRNIVFSDDGKWLAAATIDNTIQVYDAESGRVVAYLPQDKTIEKGKLALSPDGQLLVVANENDVRVWAINLSWEQNRFEHVDSNASAVSSDGRYFATVAFNFINVFEQGATPETWPVVLPADAMHTSALAFSLDGEHIAAVNGSTVYVCETRRGGSCQSLPQQKTNVDAVAFSWDGRRLALASEEAGTIWIKDVRGNAEIAAVTIDDSLRPITSVALSRDGKHVAIGSNHAVYVYEISGQKKGYRIPHPYTNVDTNVPTVAFTDDSRYLCTANNVSAHMWDISILSDPKEVARINLNEEVGKQFRVMRSVFSLNGQSLATDAAKTTGNIVDNMKRPTTWVWRWQPQDLMSEVCRRLSRNLTQQEWTTELGNETYCRVCPNLPGPPETCRYPSLDNAALRIQTARAPKTGGRR